MRTRIYPVVLALCGVFALLNLGNSLLYQWTRADVGVDFHPYWYFGQYLRQGRDMYYPLLHDPDMLALPVRFLDGVVVDRYPVRMVDPPLSLAAAYTAPLLFVLSLFSWFSWPTAESLWYLCSFASMLAAPFILMQLVPAPQRLTFRYQALVALLFFSLYGTRIALYKGQVDLLLLVLIFGAFALMDRSWLMAGILLGVALSKYSFALPAFVLLILMRRFRAALVALAVQLVAFVVISALPGGSAAQTLEAWQQMVLLHEAQGGIHLGATLLADNALAAPLLALLTAGVLALVVYRVRQLGWLRGSPPALSLQALLVYSVLNLLVLLVAYHRDYDIVLVLVPLLLLVHGFAQGGFGALSVSERRSLLLFTAALLVTFALLGNGMPGLLARFAPGALDRWLNAAESVYSLILLYALAICLLLLVRPYPARLQRTHLPPLAETG